MFHLSPCLAVNSVLKQRGPDLWPRHRPPGLSEPARTSFFRVVIVLNRRPPSEHQRYSRHRGRCCLSVNSSLNPSSAQKPQPPFNRRGDRGSEKSSEFDPGDPVHLGENGKWDISQGVSESKVGTLPTEDHRSGNQRPSLSG